MLQGCLHIIHEKKPCNDIIKLLKSGSHDKWEMTRHDSQQSGGRCDWSMTPLETSKLHTDMLFAQHSLSSSCLWAFMNYEIKSTLSGFSALNCSILNYAFKILDNLNL